MRSLDKIDLIRQVKLYRSGVSILVMSLILTSCFDTEKSETTVDKNAFQSYQMDLEAPKVELLDLIEELRVTRLEETDQSLLSNVVRIEYLNGRYLTFNKMGDIFLFNEAGSFLRKINKLGDGPEEYRSISDLWLDDDQITVYSRASSIISRYSIQGEFIDSKRLPYRVGHINRYKEGYVIESNFNPINDSLKYKFAALNESLEPTALYLKYDEIPDNVIWSDNNSVIQHDNSALLFRMYSDTVHQFKNNTFSPLVHFNFGEDWFWKGKPQFSQKDFEKIESSQQAWEMSMSFGDEFIYVKAIIGYSHWAHFLINRSSGTIVRLEMLKENGKELTLTNLTWKNDELMFSVSPSDLKPLLDAIQKKGVKVSGDINLQDIERSENPVLLFAKFKD